MQSTLTRTAPGCETLWVRIERFVAREIQAFGTRTLRACGAGRTRRCTLQEARVAAGLSGVHCTRATATRENSNPALGLAFEARARQNLRRALLRLRRVLGQNALISEGGGCPRCEDVPNCASWHG